MARSQNSFIKKQKENNAKGGDLSDMMAYLDENGNIISEPPEKGKDEENKD